MRVLAINDGLRTLHTNGQLPSGTDPDDLAVTLLAVVQGGPLLARLQTPVRRRCPMHQAR
jgi:hypothetical protein